MRTCIAISTLRPQAPPQSATIARNRGPFDAPLASSSVRRSATCASTFSSAGSPTVMVRSPTVAMSGAAGSQCDRVAQARPPTASMCRLRSSGRDWRSGRKNVSRAFMGGSPRRSQRLQVLHEVVPLGSRESERLARVVGLHDVGQCRRGPVVEVRGVLPDAAQRSGPVCMWPARCVSAPRRVLAPHHPAGECRRCSRR